MRTRPPAMHDIRRSRTCSLAALLFLACAPAGRVQPAAPPPAEDGAAAVPAESDDAEGPAHTIIPTPAQLDFTGGRPFTFSAETAIGVEAADSAAASVGDYLAALLRPSTDFDLPVRPLAEVPAQGSIRLRLGGDPSLGEEAYRMEVTATGIELTAASP